MNRGPSKRELELSGNAGETFNEAAENTSPGRFYDEDSAEYGGDHASSDERGKRRHRFSTTDFFSSFMSTDPKVKSSVHFMKQTSR